MKEIKKIGIGILVFVIAIVIFGIYWLISDWTFRYHSELDEFFGKGNWEVVSEEVESEKIATIRSNSSWSGYGQDRRKKNLQKLEYYVY